MPVQLICRMYELAYTKQAIKDAKKLKQSNLKDKAKEILALIEKDPFASPPHFEKLIGNLHNHYSRRLNQQHRIVYEVHKKEKVVRIIRMWTHYE